MGDLPTEPPFSTWGEPWRLGLNFANFSKTNAMSPSISERFIPFGVKPNSFGSVADVFKLRSPSAQNKVLLPEGYHRMIADAGGQVKSDVSPLGNAGSARLIPTLEKKPDQDLLKAYKAVDDEVNRLFRGVSLDESGRPTGRFKTGNSLDDLMAIRRQMDINNLLDGVVVSPLHFDPTKLIEDK